MSKLNEKMWYYSIEILKFSGCIYFHFLRLSTFSAITEKYRLILPKIQYPSIFPCSKMNYSKISSTISEEPDNIWAV